jgi:hypothetical protein
MAKVFCMYQEVSFAKDQIEDGESFSTVYFIFADSIGKIANEYDKGMLDFVALHIPKNKIKIDTSSPVKTIIYDSQPKKIFLADLDDNADFFLFKHKKEKDADTGLTIRSLLNSGTVADIVTNFNIDKKAIEVPVDFVLNSTSTSPPCMKSVVFEQ